MTGEGAQCRKGEKAIAALHSQRQAMGIITHDNLVQDFIKAVWFSWTNNYFQYFCTSQGLYSC